MSDFTVRPFAFMRLTHEALRDGLARLQRAADAGDLSTLRREYDALQPVITLHARQEEEVFFPMLDDLFDGAVRQAGLREAHQREDDHELALATALFAGSTDAARAAVATWSVSFEQHLVEEEEVMMPLTRRVAPTMEGRAAAVRTILELDWEALRDVHLPYVLDSLAATKPYGPTRMFVAALQAASGERYPELVEVIGASLPASTTSQLRAHGHLQATS